ncbi:MAG: threonine aldolase family protein, partial [Actinomycetota bacterium]
SEWAACADTVSFCFSKGLGAPIGSMVVGSNEVIEEARRLRKRLGGGMRQVGVIAAAARVAIETGPQRLHEDHANARRLAEGLADLHGEAVDLTKVETNMVYVDVRPFGKRGPDVTEALATKGVITLPGAGGIMRFVTHRDVDAPGIERALEALRQVLTTG